MLNVNWTPPTTKTDGTAADPASTVLVEIAALPAAGSSPTYQTLGNTALASSGTFTANNPAAGQYTLRLTVVDSLSQLSTAVETPAFTVPVATPTQAGPNPVTNVTVSVTLP